MTSDYKPSEPVTIVTDLILAIQGFLFSLILYFFLLELSFFTKKNTIKC